MRITRKELTEMVEDEVANALLDVSVSRLQEGYVKSTMVDVDALVDELADEATSSSGDFDELVVKFKQILGIYGIVDR